ncbi:maleylpyruvate isomerase family mycothiol-dependent enzyme [Rhodococcus spelaei]|uniref:Maleylpyruvate isomerase family mycothiol-dependent enzyme n=1 Tax=Rhodococcus spelaei TaxID=2546320 RepID=A0A541BRR3_9NOCA|nr:maleylpyruvate isomerase family mycothiol-dependent enzyme [Rhodococcus spelaei]TQF75037.1 maleylpyruvate isomerase family mycothiol-dependent enzyme [Rhodococcus spelaei]
MTLPYAEVIALVAQSQGRVEETLATLTEAQARGTSALPGWSRGHVVTHLARNADALNRFALGVLDGTPREMYPGGPDARAAAIEEGADRPVELLAADLRFAGRRVIDSLRSIGPDLLGTTVKWRKPVAARDVPVLRWRELEIHHLDLGLGYSCVDWPEEFVESTLDSQLPELAMVAPDLPLPELPRAELLAWIVGRPTRDGLPTLPTWPF